MIASIKKLFQLFLVSLLQKVSDRFKFMFYGLGLVLYYFNLGLETYSLTLANAYFLLCEFMRHWWDFSRPGQSWRYNCYWLYYFKHLLWSLVQINFTCWRLQTAQRVACINRELLVMLLLWNHANLFHTARVLYASIHLLVNVATVSWRRWYM